jgi:hypothetical protein
MKGLVTAIGAGVVCASMVAAQTSQAPPPGLKRPPMVRTEGSGTIKSVDPAGRTVLLADGTRLMIPESVSVNPADLKPGATVKASVEEKGGQKVVTAIQIN